MQLNQKYTIINEDTGLPLGYAICPCSRLFKKVRNNQVYCVGCRAKFYPKKKKKTTKMYKDYQRIEKEKKK